MRLLYKEDEIKELFQELFKRYSGDKEVVKVFTPLVGIPQFFRKKFQRRIIIFTIGMLVPTIFSIGYLLIFNSFYAFPLLLLFFFFQLPLTLNLRFLNKTPEYGIIIPRLKIFQVAKVNKVIEHELRHLLKYSKNVVLDQGK